MTPAYRSALPVWALVVVGALLVAFLAHGDYLNWIPLVMAGSVLATFCLQLAVVRKEGFVGRLMITIAGSIGILAIATLVLWLVTLT